MDSQRYPTPARQARIETLVVNSRFIATLAPAFSVEEAKEFIATIRAEFSEASHNVPAYLIGYGNSVIAHSSDDGEPSGTAGKPALAVLRGSGLGDAVVVVTRYFGGTKLGTGGLVRAYSNAVRQVIEIATRAERIPTNTVMLDIPYRLLDRVRLFAASQHGEILAEDFTAEVSLTIRFPVEHLTTFQEALRDLSNGAIQAEIIETGETLVPLP